MRKSVYLAIRDIIVQGSRVETTYEQFIKMDAEKQEVHS